MFIFLKYSLIGNVEGCIVTFLTYFLFRRIFPFKNLLGEKPLSFKRNVTALVLVAFYGLIFYLVIVQGPRSDPRFGWPTVDLWLFAYSCFSGYSFVFKPGVIDAEGG